MTMHVSLQHIGVLVKHSVLMRQDTQPQKSLGRLPNHHMGFAWCRLYAFEAVGLLLGQEELPADEQQAYIAALLRPLIQQVCYLTLKGSDPPTLLNPSLRGLALLRSIQGLPSITPRGMTETPHGVDFSLSFPILLSLLTDAAVQTADTL